ncbi:protein kinase [Actinoplanes sp. NPDC048967]|uniref:serine/threonine-protein kinase n=1 Tax=Actinoplanes sp. NPDC048967 TaxID=3155269 RepID=UPI0033C81F75
MTTDPADGELVPLGDGAAGTVLAGVDSATGEAFAVKVLPGPLDRRTRAGLDAELHALAGPAEHAPILLTRGVVELGDGRHGLRMELCSQSLPELVAAFGPLSVADSVTLGIALADALTAAHGAGVVHGSVTPGNVLFRADGEPVLADFGMTLRRAFPAASARSRDFTAPENRRDGTADERSDLYGLGAVLHLALTGSPPSDAPQRDDLPSAFAEVISALLAENPADRPPGAAAVAASLRTVAASLRTVAPAGNELAAPQPAGGPAAPQPAAGPIAPQPANGPIPPPSAAGPTAPQPAGAPIPPQPAGAPKAPQPAGGPIPPPSAAGPTAPRPAGGPLLVFGPRRRSRLRAARGPAVVLALVAVAALLFRLNQPADLGIPAAPGAAPAAAPERSRPAVRLELADLTDRGDVIDLAWRSSEPLSFAILLAGEDGSTRTFLAQRATSYSVPVDPAARYCLLVQGTNGVDIYSTPPEPVRGAVCKQ